MFCVTFRHLTVCYSTVMDVQNIHVYVLMCLSRFSPVAFQVGATLVFFRSLRSCHFASPFELIGQRDVMKTQTLCHRRVVAFGR